MDVPKINEFTKDGQKYVQIGDLPPIKVANKLDVDEEHKVVAMRVDDGPTYIPSEVRPCAKCGELCWISKVVLQELAWVKKWHINCLECVATIGPA